MTRRHTEGTAVAGGVRLVVVVVAASIAAAACAEGGDNDAATSVARNGTAAITEPSSATASVNTPATSGSVAATTESAAGLAVVVSATAVLPEVNVAIVGHRDGFVRIGPEGDGLAVSWSADGSVWAVVTDAVPLTYVTALTSDGDALLAVGDSGGDVPAAASAFSTDGGATWSPAFIEPSTAPAGFATARVNIGGIALADGAAVAVGTVFVEVDWVRYSREVLGADHGRPTGEERSPTPTGQELTVEFEDGFRLTVDAAALGVDVTAQRPPTMGVWAGDGTAWTPVDAALGSGFGNPDVVAGPAGFVTIGSEPGGALQVYRSPDGRAWTASPLPDDFGGIPPSLAGGPLGYVLAGEDRLYHSTDSVSWVEVHSFTDPAPNVYAVTGLAGPAGGGAGFLTPVSRPTDGSGEPIRVLSSATGLDWAETALPADADLVLLAVSDTTRLAFPVSVRSNVPAVEFTTDEDAIAAIAATFDPDVVPVGPVTEDEADCIARRLVDTLGRQRLSTLGFGAAPWHLLGYALGRGPFERSDAESIVDSFRACSPNWEQLMITSVTEGADRISSQSAACIADLADDDESREVFVHELDRPEGDNLPADQTTRLITGYMNCLTPDEQTRMDWD